MNRGDNFELDPEFNENFSKNIEKVLNDADIDIGNPVKIDNLIDSTVNNEPPEEADTIYADLSEVIDMQDSDISDDDDIKASDMRAQEDEKASDTSAFDDGETSVGRAQEDEKASDTPILDDGETSEGQVTQDKNVMNEQTDEDVQLSDVQDDDDPESLQQEVEQDTGDTEGEVDEVLADINEMLAKQISDELGITKDENGMDNKKTQKSRKVLMGWLITLGCLAVIACFLGFTKPGHKLLLNMGISLSGKIWGIYTKDIDDKPVINDYDEIVPDQEDIESDSVEVDPDTIIWPEHTENGIPEGRHEDYVYNILLLGEEDIKSGDAPGRTDLMVIATLNTREKSIKLTSLMRDMLVKIPGYKENRINSVYEKGGLDLLYKAIALNFDIKIDGCALVNFEKFEKIIDKMGGLDITLTAAEAKYLNHTNYISKPQYRTVVEGKQHMNGNQVLGYTRIRKRAAVTGNNNDYGRTDRHRIVLDAIFEKYKSKSKLDLVSTMFSMLPLIETDITDKNFEYLLDAFVETGADNIEQLRIPANGTFQENVKVRGLDVLIPNLDKNNKLLHEFIFGDYKG